MGGSSSKNHCNEPNYHQDPHGHHPRPPPPSKVTSAPIKNNYQTLEEVQNALRKAGLESSNLILGIDYTKSNEWTGKASFFGQNLHALHPQRLNPYQEAIAIVGKTLEPFDDDKMIPAFGFGDSRTTDKSVFAFRQDRPCHGFQEVMQAYNEITPLLIFSGPTSFAPVIRQAINIVRQEKAYHILVIIADGAVTNVKETYASIVEASNYPLSIVVVGVGDGPWELMEEFDDGIPERKFDNFQFVPFNKTLERSENREVDFAVAALMEIPEQFTLIRQLGYL
eukprot:TRINITY_DN718_c0_g1_i1.p1 TRINITY_DN718_c0_g1~~TRINITY_DN718_c0_g1_i1.p1  ORF type:complete len:281 (-),score=75.61 TRINITY_DN718_c0_g1_i1:101-943(-)